MGAVLNKRAKLLKRDTTSDLFSVVEYWDEDKVFILDEPAIGAFIICQPTPGSNDDIRNSLENFFKTDFPEGTIVQMQLASLPDLENRLYGYNRVRGNRMLGKDQEQIELLSDSISNFYRRGTLQNINDNGYRFRDYEFWISIKVPIKKAIPSENELKSFKRRVRSTVSTLSQFAPVIADEFQYKRRMSVMLNMYGDASWKGKPHHQDKCQIDRPLRELFLDQGKRIEPTDKGVEIYDQNGEMCQFVKSISITDMPEKMLYGQMINLLGDWEQGNTLLDEHFILSLNVEYPNQKSAKDKFSKSRTFITNQAKGSILQYLDKLRFQKMDFDAVNRELDQSGSLLIKYSMQMLCFTKNEQSANDFVDKVQGMYSKKNISIMQDNFFTLPFMLAGLPFGVDAEFVKSSHRFKKATTKALPFLTPHMASWKGNTPNPTLLLGSRFGQAVSIDFFESDTNFNIYGAATSGAGKSFFIGFLTNAILGVGVKEQDNDNERQEYDDGAQVFIIDVGRSYVGLAEQYDQSQFLAFGRDFKYSLNPFSNVTDFYGKEGEINMIRTLIKTMASPSGNISDLQNAEILEVLKVIWEAKGASSTITDFANECLKHELVEMHLIGRQLKPFCDNGIYGDFFGDKYPPVNFDGRLVVCELEELKSDSHLQVTVLMALVMGIQNKMYLSSKGDTPRRRMFILDEAWEYLKEDKNGASMMQFFADFLETGWRRFRKYGAAGALVTQSVMDAYTSVVGRAIIANSKWMLLMKQQPEQVERLKEEKAFTGNETDFKLLSSLKTVKARPAVTDEAFSEVLVKDGLNSQVCRLYTDRKFQLILTTDKKEKDKRQEYIDRGMTMADATNQMIEDEKLSAL